ncbi:hypothetical protein MHBO_003097 [Bonamia ostreae]|uniref:Helicase C-terminal domain-containing protein n=1 Tax=Bonamia ostreae TaxID=126728 RepID=A0ABV2APU9_9EUKA
MVDNDDVEYWLRRALRKNNWSKNHPFLRCINRGIAVHHNGMSRAYKTLVEVLFRAKHIKVVLTVGTLALGVNMPCRTAVFAGDSSELTPLRYRQMMGRAGRRGYDNIGKVIFFGIPPQKISYLMTSSLLSLHGHETISVTSFLRNLFCVASATDKTFRLKALRNTMKRTFGDDLDNSAQKPLVSKQTKLLYRYSMEYLLINGLINKNLIPVHFSGLVTKLYSTEPANFVFSMLLQQGVFDSICNPLPVSLKDENELKEQLKSSNKTKEERQNENLICIKILEILAHLFFRVPLPGDFRKPPYFNSAIVLKPLPENAKKVVAKFNLTSIALFEQFLQLSYLLNDKSSKTGDFLPVSKTRFCATDQLTTEEMNVDRTEDMARNGFAAIACRKGRFESGQEIGFSGEVHDIEFRKTDSIPVIELKDIHGKDLLLSAYVLVFKIEPF